MMKKIHSIFFYTLFLVLCFSFNTHSSQDEENFAGDETCLECHEEIYENFWKNIHGIEGDPRTPAGRSEGFVCESCHGPGIAHAEEGEGGGILWLSAKSSESPEKKNEVCLQCHSKGKVAMWHAKTRGPYLWEHPPAVEDCLTCHVSHGSSQAFLLNARTPYLCQRCHSNLGHASGLQAKNTSQAGRSVYTALNNRGFYRGCLNCHLQVHGSNHPSGKSLLR
jgi:predicted CXXCH cytochrome family protein